MVFLLSLFNVSSLRLRFASRIALFHMDFPLMTSFSRLTYLSISWSRSKRANKAATVSTTELGDISCFCNSFCAYHTGKSCVSKSSYITRDLQ